MDSPPPQRIAKVLARAGVCSRRDAEKWILEGRVSVDGVTLTTPATLVTDASKIVVDGYTVASPEEPRLWCYYKPVGYLTTHKDPQGRLTVFEDLSRFRLPRLISIGRLDINSEGLLLLTNDGALSRYAELPSTKWPRRYHVRVFGTIDKKQLLSLENGITIDGIHYGQIEVEFGEQKGANTWISMTLYEGKNREIRKVMEHFNLKVNRLIRDSYGPFSLMDLKPGEITEVPRKEILKHFIMRQ